MTARDAWNWNFTGWILFTASAVFFTWLSFEAMDWKSILASLFFLIACLVFLVPVWRTRPPRDRG
ncbi:MAG: cytochrome oxidase subunit III [Alphaproteobacteria bacterium]